LKELADNCCGYLQRVNHGLLHSISDLKATISYTVSETGARSQCRIREKPVSARRKSSDAQLWKLRRESWHGHCHFRRGDSDDESFRNDIDGRSGISYRY